MQGAAEDGGVVTGRGVGRISDLPDIDRLEGYDSNMECDPPADYYDAYSRNEQNILRLHYFIAGFLADTGRDGIQIDQVAPAPAIRFLSCPSPCLSPHCPSPPSAPPGLLSRQMRKRQATSRPRVFALKDARARGRAGH